MASNQHTLLMVCTWITETEKNLTWLVSSIFRNNAPVIERREFSRYWFALSGD